MANSSPSSLDPDSGQPKKALAIAVTSGKGGVGKTNITTNLGIALAKKGHKVCIFDADTSLANINILLGMSPQFTLEQFLSGEKSIDDIMLTGPLGVKVVPAASGIAEFAELNDGQQSRIVQALETLEEQFDYILIDTAAGISENVIRFLQSAQYAVIVISPEPTSLTDAFSLIKVLQRRHYDKPVYTLVNMANNYKHSMDVFKRFSHAINKYVHMKVRYLGYIPMDRAMRSAVATQSPVVISEPNSPAARCISLLTQILLKHFKPNEASNHSISEFWHSQATPLQSIPTLSEVHNPPIEITKDAAEVISSQQDKEASRILALTNDALANQEFSQSQAEDLLANAIENYLIQFGTLPQQTIDMVVKTNNQNPQQPQTNQPSDQRLTGNNTNVDNIHEPFSKSTAISNQSTPVTMAFTSPASTNNPTAQSNTPLNSVQNQIDSLVNDAERTKRELTEISVHLRNQYRSLYNTDQPLLKSNPAPTSSNPSAETEDRIALAQSIRFASATDQSSKA